MTVFESLNCILCKQPFARVADQPQTPRFSTIRGFALTMCNECFVKRPGLCYSDANVAYFLIDVLSQENALILTPFGYVLQKPFKIPECPICLFEYSNEIEAKKSFGLHCGHMICTECWLKMKSPFGNYCPTCHNFTHSDLNKQRNPFHDFLNELPEMTRQMKRIDSSKMKAFNAVMSSEHNEDKAWVSQSRKNLQEKKVPEKTRIPAQMNVLTNSKDDQSCSECHKKDIIDDMFYCGECGCEICGTCAYKNHHPHKAIPLLEKQVNQMLMELQQGSKNAIKRYKSLVPELHKELLEDIDSFETKLLSKEGILKEASTFADLREKHESFTQIESTFESFAENYLLHLRKFDTKAKKLLQTLKEIPDV